MLQDSQPHDFVTLQSHHPRSFSRSRMRRPATSLLRVSSLRRDLSTRTPSRASRVVESSERGITKVTWVEIEDKITFLSSEGGDYITETDGELARESDCFQLECTFKTQESEKQQRVDCSTRARQRATKYPSRTDGFVRKLAQAFTRRQTKTFVRDYRIKARIGDE